MTEKEKPEKSGKTSKSGKTGRSKKDKVINPMDPNPTDTPIGPEIGSIPTTAQIQTTGLVVGENPEPSKAAGKKPVRDATQHTPEGHVEDVAESSTGHMEQPRDKETTIGNVNLSEMPSYVDMWTTLKAITKKLEILTEKVASVSVMQPVVQPDVATAVTGTVKVLPTGAADGDDAVMEIGSPLPRASRKKVDYLSLLEHVAKLGTRHFKGSSDPIEADEWRSRLVRNFKSTRCPLDYRKDIAVHFLEGDAHNWWIAVEKRMGDRVITFSDFAGEFNKKYFPPEAWDRLEAKFLDLVQGNRTVREYEEEFNRLRRYVGRELDDEKAQVRRFLRGLRLEIRNACSVVVFSTVAELVERAAIVEIGLVELRRANSAKSHDSKSGSKKRKHDDADKASGSRPECDTCGKRHGGQCWKALGACGRCGSKDHGTQNCTQSRGGNSRPSGEGNRMCYHCGKTGHFKRECPKLQVERQRDQRSNRGGDEPAAKRHAGTPRVYEMSKGVDESGNYSSITGT